MTAKKRYFIYRPLEMLGMEVEVTSQSFRERAFFVAGILDSTELKMFGRFSKHSENGLKLIALFRNMKKQNYVFQTGHDGEFMLGCTSSKSLKNISEIDEEDIINEEYFSGVASCCYDIIYIPEVMNFNGRDLRIDVSKDVYPILGCRWKMDIEPDDEEALFLRYQRMIDCSNIDYCSIGIEEYQKRKRLLDTLGLPTV